MRSSKSRMARFCSAWDSAQSRIICCSDFLRGILVDSYGVDPRKVVTIFNAYHGPVAGAVPQTRAELPGAVAL